MSLLPYRVLITDNAHPVLCQRLTEAGFDCVVDTSVTYESLLACVNNFDAIVVRSKVVIDAPFLEHCSRLRCIGRLGAGMETIDVACAESKGIACLNSPEGNRDAVGEHAVGLLLSLFNKINRADLEVRKGLWRREANRGVEIKGKTIGIIGFGNMGAAFAQRLQGFECNVVSYDKYKSSYARYGAREVSLEELQAVADVVSLHVPLTDETFHMVNKRFLESFAKPPYVINTSRGAVVNTDDLAQALLNGTIAGAGLDVLEYEAMTSDGLSGENMPASMKVLTAAENTVLTPHVAGWTVESKFKLAAFLADKIIETLKQ